MSMFVMFAALVLATTVVVMFVSLYEAWINKFQACRVPRTSNESPSFLECPDLVDPSYRNLGNKTSDEKMPQSPSSTKPNRRRAARLCMNHVLISLKWYIWTMIFVGPNALFLWIKGIVWLLIRQRMVRMGLLVVPPCDENSVVANLFLEGTLAIYFEPSEPHQDKDPIATFAIHDIPLVSPDGTVKVYDTFQVEIDLQSKRMIRATLDNEELTPSQTLIVTWFITVLVSHPKLHALANWGVNVEAAQCETNPIIHRNSVVTVIYNHFGHDTFPSYVPLWKRIGLLSSEWRQEAAMEVIDKSTSESNGIVHHSNVDKLMKHSTLVNFIVKARGVFHSEFRKHHTDFPGINGEAMFVGTVLHSLDHTCMAWNLEDPLWLDVSCPKFGLMAELGRVVRVGFVEDLPGLLFERRFRDCPHQFYRNVYRKAAKINCKLADSMDTCIVK